MRLFSGLLMAILVFPFVLLGQAVGTTSTGLASYFSNEFHGSTTKYGELYNRNDLVAAHKSYPYNSLIRVTNLENNRQVNVRVIDQGPFITGRIIEVSYRAAELLGMLESKTAKVHIELLSNSDIAATNTNNKASNTRLADQRPEVSPPPPPTPGVIAPPSNTSPAPPPAEETPAPSPAERVVSAPAHRANIEATPPNDSPDDTALALNEEVKGKKEALTYAPVQNKMFTKGKFGTGLYKVEIREPGSGTHGVQVASLSSLESAMQEVAKLQAKWFDNILINCVETAGKMSYKIILGPHENQAVASSYAKQLLKKHRIKGFVVVL